MLNKLQELREKRDDKGFTLIELLVVVVIIGILIAIAIPLYLNYQKGAKNKSAGSDTRNAIAVIEQCYSDNNNVYPGGMTSGAGADIDLSTATPACANGKINVSPGNILTYTPGATSYTISTKAGSPGDKTYTYNSATGDTTVS